MNVRLKRKNLVAICLIPLFAAVLLGGILMLHRQEVFASSGDFTAEEQTEESKFFGNGDLLGLYKIPASAITYTNNGGGDIDKAFDGNFGTQWTSTTENRGDTDATEGFFNSITVTFAQPVTINRVLYQASDARVAHGYPTQLELQYATEEKSEEFISLGTCTSRATVNRVVFQFGETSCKKFRLIFKEVNKAHNWVATAKEIVFLTPEDAELEKLAHLFSDYAQTKLASGIDKDFIARARTKYENRLNYAETIGPILDRAEKVLEGTLTKDINREYGTGITGDNAISRYGNIRGYCANTLKMSTFGIDYQPTGIEAVGDTELTVYVEADEGDPLPNIVFTQTFGDWRSWISRFGLTRGKNVFTVPNFIANNTTAYTVQPESGLTPGGPVYLENTYTETEQSANVKVYIEGGDFYPLFRKGGNVKEFIDDIQKYREKMQAAPEKYADVAEIASDHILVTSLVSSAYGLFVQENYSPEESCAGWDTFMEQLLSFGGVPFNKGDAYYQKINAHLRHNLRLAQPWAGALAYASGGFCGFCMGAYKDDFALFRFHQYGWAMPHELGHAFDNNMGSAGRTITEVTNNMWAIYNRIAIEKNPEERYNTDTYRDALAPDKKPDIKTYEKYRDTGYVFWWQIESRYPGFWGKMENMYRYHSVENDMTDAGISDEEKKLLTQEERHAYLCSLAAETDLTYYFDRWGFYFNTKTVGEGENAKTVPSSQFDADHLSAAYTKLMDNARLRNAFPKPQLKFWYSDYWNYNYVSGGINGLYSEESTVTVTDVFASESGYTVILPEETDEAHLGYEIVEGGHVVGFTGGSAFTDRNSYPKGYTPSYQVRAYDRLLNASALSSVVSPAVSQGEVCRIGETEFHTLAEAFAAAAEGDVIELLDEARTSAITVDKSVTLTGNFTVLRGVTGNLFTVKSGATLTLRGGEGERDALRIDGGKFSQNGALIRIETGGTLVAEGSVILENNYSAGDGGAIFASGDMRLNGTLLRGNRAKNGGAIREDTAATDSVFTHVCFENNTAAENGGAVSQRGTMRFSDCTFVANSAKNGGAVANYEGGVLYLDDLRVERNTAAENGGGFYTDGYADFKGGTFLSNHAKKGGGICFAAGNAVRKGFVGNGKTPIKFKTNIAEKGGALYINSNAPVAVSAIAVVGNRANEQGSVFYLEKGTLTFPNLPTEVPDFTFTGWELNGKNVTAFDTFNENDFLDAAGTVRYYATFYADGEAQGESKLFDEGTSYVLPEFEGKTEKRRFMGWNVNGTLYAAGDSVVIHEDLSIEATFLNEYDAIIKVDGEVREKQTVLEGEAFILPEAPEPPEGKTFKGWLVHSAVRAPGDEIFLTGDVEITAVFEDIENGSSTVLIVCVSVAAVCLVAMAGTFLGIHLHRRRKSIK